MRWQPQHGGPANRTPADQGGARYPSGRRGQRRQPPPARGLCSRGRVGATWGAAGHEPEGGGRERWLLVRVPFAWVGGRGESGSLGLWEWEGKGKECEWEPEPGAKSGLFEPLRGDRSFPGSSTQAGLVCDTWLILKSVDVRSKSISKRTLKQSRKGFFRVENRKSRVQQLPLSSLKFSLFRIRAPISRIYSRRRVFPNPALRGCGTYLPARVLAGTIALFLLSHGVRGRSECCCGGGGGGRGKELAAEGKQDNPSRGTRIPTSIARRLRSSTLPGRGWHARSQLLLSTLFPQYRCKHLFLSLSSVP